MMTTITTSRYASRRMFASSFPAMATFLLLLIASFQFKYLVVATDPSARIVGGQDADEFEYPWYVSWGRSCGATVIHDDILLTAAHVSCEKNSFHSDTSLELSIFDTFSQNISYSIVQSRRNESSTYWSI